MAVTTVLNQNNVHVPVVPPDLYVWENAARQLTSSLSSAAAGGAMPVGLKAWQAIFDCTGLPDGQTLFTITLEFQRDAWVDAAGVAHPQGEWLPDVGPDSLPTKNLKTGSKLIAWGSTIGAVNPATGAMIEPYPTHYRFHLTACSGWIVPNITLNLMT